MSDNKGPIQDRDKNKEEQGRSRNFSNRMYGYEEGDEKPGAAKGDEADNIADREGAIRKNTHKSGISYEPDKDTGSVHGGYGRGNENKGSEGPQGYGASDNEQYKDTDYNGLLGNKKEDE